MTGKTVRLNDPHLDDRDPHTRMFLLCEHWRNRTDEARDLIRRLIDAIDGNGAVGDGLQRLRDEADLWLAQRATTPDAPDGFEVRPLDAARSGERT